jgi:hypothetical protein
VKYFSLFCLGALLLAVTGCEEVQTKVHDRFTGPVYQTKVVNVDQHKAYEAARAALTKMNFSFERGGPAQGKITAIGPMDTSAAGPGTARQLWFDAKLSPAVEGSGTTIEVLVSEFVEDDFNKRPGQGAPTPLRDSPIYEVFFHYVDEALAAKP